MTKNINLTSTLIQGLTHKEKMRLSHKIAGKLEGNYSARLKLAWQYIKSIDVETMNNLFNLPLKPLKASKPKNDYHEINLNEILASLKDAPYQKMENVNSEVVAYFIEYELKNISDKYDYLRILDGVQALSVTEDYQLFTTIMITYFLKTTIRSKVFRLLEYGINYKNLEKRTLEQLMYDYNYQNAPSTSGKISLFDIDDIYNELVENSMRLNFGKEMFSEQSHVHKTLFFRIKNAIRVQLKQIDYNIINKPVDDMLTYIDSMVTIDKPLEERVSEQLDNLDLTDIERDIIELRYRGYQNKEINKILSNKYNMKRFDRHFYKAQEKLGMTRNWEFAN